MRMWGALILVALPMLAHAAPLKEGKDWRDCGMDVDCVLVDGLCSKTSVNTGYKEDAEAFYRQERPNAKCVEKFWETKSVVAQCRLGSCSTAAKSAKSNSKK